MQIPSEALRICLFAHVWCAKNPGPGTQSLEDSSQDSYCKKWLLAWLTDAVREKMPLRELLSAFRR